MYTQQEIEFNELTEKIKDSILKIKLDTEKVSLILSAYGFSKNEITDIIMTKLKEGIPSLWSSWNQESTETGVRNF